MTPKAHLPKPPQPDQVYQLLVESYTGLSESEVAKFHACLVLLLICQIGDGGAIGEAIAEAQRMARSTQKHRRR